MSHGPEHHIEHAEHAAHAVGDSFNKNVTMSIAIVAAVLACVTMLGHRCHNEVLHLQGEALALQSEAAIKSTNTANKWAYYQNKNIFNLESQIALDFLKFMSLRELTNEQKKEFDLMVKGYEKNVEKYSGNKEVRSWSKTTAVEGKLAEIKKEADDLSSDTDKLLEKAKEKVMESHLAHEKAARLDYGELALQLAVVLCSLAILTRNRGFWFAGIGCGGLGALIALSAQLGMFLGGSGHH